MRLDRFLSDMGAGTRKELKEKIRSGEAAVNGVPVKDPGTKVSEEDTVVFCGRIFCYEKFTYLMMNKPAGVISATEDPKERTVLDLIAPPLPKGLAPVGRLDKDTVGLLLLTNDGALAHSLLSPKHHVDKVYLARVAGCLTEEDVKAFLSGIALSDHTCLPAKLEILSAGAGSEARVTLQEGRFHQVKRMFSAVGKEVLFLKRLSMGGLTLDPALPEGSCRKLTAEELMRLRSQGKTD